MKTLKHTALALFILIPLVVSGLLLDLFFYCSRPADPEGEPVVIQIPKGQGLGSVIQTLTREGIIHHPFRFELATRLLRYEKKIRAGQYRLSPSMPPFCILDTLIRGRVIRLKVSIPEGKNIKEISLIMENAGIAGAQSFYRLATRKDVAEKFGIPADTLEGYLFPETYYVQKGRDAMSVILQMVEGFRAVFKEEWKARAKKMGFSVHEIVTLASVIEKETGAKEERRLISSVFHNRLRKGMRLQSDPTVIYGILQTQYQRDGKKSAPENPDHQKHAPYAGNLTKEHLKTPTPYNTYTRAGLPPGPIASPGKDALYAALFPEDTDYLYFVSRNDGTHHFSRNLKAHNRAVNQYQRRRK